MKLTIILSAIGVWIISVCAAAEQDDDFSAPFFGNSPKSPYSDAALTKVESALLEDWRKWNPGSGEPVTLDDLSEGSFRRQLNADLQRAEWAMSVKPAHVPSKEEVAFTENLIKAEAGDAEAQFQIGEMYDRGRYVKQSYSEAFKWYVQSANQGHVVAQHNVGVAYTAGLGVWRNYERAIHWLNKAGAQGDQVAQNYALRLEAGESASVPVRMVAFTKSSIGIAHGMPQSVGSQNIAILEQLLANYTTNSDYSVENDFMCSDMAIGVWSMLAKHHIAAKIRIGSVDKNIDSLKQANHAWVMATVDRGYQLALEATGGFIAYPEEYRGYYRGPYKDFSNPKEVKEYISLIREYNEALTKVGTAQEEYKTQYRAYELSRGQNQIVHAGMIEKKANLEMRQRDFDEKEGKLMSLLYGR